MQREINGNEFVCVDCTKGQRKIKAVGGRNTRVVTKMRVLFIFPFPYSKNDTDMI